MYNHEIDHLHTWPAAASPAPALPPINRSAGEWRTWAKFEGGSGDGLITKEEFIEYYAKSVSPSIDHDDHFVMLVRKAWGGKYNKQPALACDF